MSFLRTLLGTMALIALFAVSQPTFAQEKDQADRLKPPPASITGCLMKAEAGDQWTLTDQAGTKIALTGSDFDKHANHMVKIIGSPSEDGKTFSVAKIESVADSCPAK